MRLMFIDVTRDFGLATPLEMPLGGTQSAVAYLARELKDAGHDVTIANATERDRIEDGVRFVPWQRFPVEGAADMDAIIPVLAPPAWIECLHQTYAGKPVWLQWCHHDANQPGVAHLKDPAMQARLDGIIVVSEWQARRYQTEFGLRWDRFIIMRNGVSPAFLNLYQPGETIITEKSRDPLLVYTSTPFRGLDLLLDAVPLIRQRVGNATFRIYSSMAVYGDNRDSTQHLETYRRCQATPGVEYRGSTGQRQLAEDMKSAWCLAYPNIFPETSCIAVMEALAAGCKIVTTHNGALPETAAGFATMVINPVSRADHVARFAAAAADVILKMPGDVVTTERELRAAVDYAHECCSWKSRAEQLTGWIEGRQALRQKAGGGLRSQAA